MREFVEFEGLSTQVVASIDDDENDDDDLKPVNASTLSAADLYIEVNNFGGHVSYVLIMS